MEIKAILSEALGCVKRAKAIEPSSGIELSALRWETYAALQNILDAMAMMVVEIGLTKPSSYSGLGHVLHESGLIDEEDAAVAKRIAVTRNMLAHAYRRISEEDLRKIVQQLLPQAEKLIQRLGEVLEQKNVDPVSNNQVLTRDRLTSLAEIFKRHGVMISYLFGSRARGKFREESDYDIAVVFVDEKPDIMKEVEMTMEIADALEVPADKVNLVALSDEEYPLIAKVLREGIPIYESSEALRKSWERKAYLKMLKETDLYAIYVRKI